MANMDEFAVIDSEETIIGELQDGRTIFMIRRWPVMLLKTSVTTLSTGLSVSTLANLTTLRIIRLSGLKKMANASGGISRVMHLILVGRRNNG